MFYFKYNEEYLDFIDIDAKIFDSNCNFKSRIQFETKPHFAVMIHDEEGNLYPVKKSSILYKNIINALVDKNWNLFTIDGQAIEGIVNQEHEVKEPLLALFPEKQKKVKINPYAKWNDLLKDNLLPIIETEEEVFYKKSINSIYHIYYRKNDTIIHVYFNEFEFILIDKEIFKKL